MNRLRHETSPYLLQHAHNPVDWYAWKPEAFERAKREDKPIIVSIGYSTCHWCHVMERESFEDEAVARFMNEHFINIKVDREERPDVDQIYMEACQAISGSGGWPLNCFLTPDGRPFYAGTYYPPKPAHNRPSWTQLLQGMSNAFREKRTAVEEQAEQLTQAIQRSDTLFLKDDLPGQAEKDQLFSTETIHQIYEKLSQRFDREEGGFGNAPKFPGTMSLKYLLDYYYYTGKEEARDHALFSIERMIRGGIYDQLGGGFARYATDRAWLTPHFEKMLYDNALLISLLSDAQRLRPCRLYREAIEQSLSFIHREMTSPEGGFYAALDADSEGEEGKFYVWDKKEIDQLLDKEEAALFCEFYDVTDSGNWEGKNILWRPYTLEEFARKKEVAAKVLGERLEISRDKILAGRAGRIRPGLDDKILLGWNALAASAFAQAYAALRNEDYKEAARKNLDFLLRKFAKPNGGGLFHTYKDGQAQYDAFLDDYAFLIAALIDLYEITFDTGLLSLADRYTTFVMDNFLDHTHKIFYFTSEKQQDLIVRRKELYDSAVPSGNSTMAGNLKRLGILLDREDYRALSIQMLEKTGRSVVKYPSSFPRWANYLLYEVYAPYEIAVTGARAGEMAGNISALFIPNKLLMASSSQNDEFPLLTGKAADGDANIFVCKDYSCQLPVKSLEKFRKLVQPDHMQNRAIELE